MGDLPLTLSSFIGREHQLAELAARALKPLSALDQ
jgi:hypothetical protein